MIGELFDLNDTSAPNNHTAHAILDSISLISGLAEPFLDRYHSFSPSEDTIC